MTRQILTIVLPLLTPFVVYYIWHWFYRRHQLAEAEGRQIPQWQELPWTWLIISGAVLVSIVFALLAIFSMDLDGSNAGGTYRTPHMENGVLVPGRIER
mgnify:CR=1 FL=1